MSTPSRRRQVAAVFRKELLEAVRDRRAMASALLYPLLGPALVGLLFTGVSRNVQQTREAPVSVVGAERAPELVGFLGAHGVTVVGSDVADADAALAAGEREVLLRIPDDHAEALAAHRPSRLVVEADFSKPRAARVAGRVAALVQTWGQRLALGRAVARGVHPEVLMPVMVEQRDHATPVQHAAALLHLLPMFTLLAAFVGAMQIAIDATAGERERGSLEPLLLHPAPTWVFAFGKWGVATAASATAGLLTLGLTAATLPLLPTEAIGISLHIGAGEVALLAAVLLPTAPMAGGLLLWAASFARSFKEAQTWLSFLLFVPMLPGLMGSAWELEEAAWMLPIPSLGQHLVTLQVLRGELPAVWAIVVAGLGSLALGLLGVWGTARQLRRERALFVGQ